MCFLHWAHAYTEKDVYTRPGVRLLSLVHFVSCFLVEMIIERSFVSRLPLRKIFEQDLNSNIFPDKSSRLFEEWFALTID